MRAEKQKATAVTMASKNKMHNKSYRNYAQRSRAKLKKEIGALLAVGVMVRKIRSFLTVE